NTETTQRVGFTDTVADIPHDQQHSMQRLPGQLDSVGTQVQMSEQVHHLRLTAQTFYLLADTQCLVEHCLGLLIVALIDPELREGAQYVRLTHMVAHHPHELERVGVFGEHGRRVSVKAVYQSDVA